MSAPHLRPSTLVLLLLALQLGALALVLWDTGREHAARRHATRASAQLTRWLGLTDPALFTEAHYTRHPSLHGPQAALFDHPLAQDHFPSGSLLTAPPALAWWRSQALDSIEEQP